jgi:hypothetical protein
VISILSGIVGVCFAVIARWIKQLLIHLVTPTIIIQEFALLDSACASTTEASTISWRIHKSCFHFAVAQVRIELFPQRSSRAPRLIRELPRVATTVVITCVPLGCGRTAAANQIADPTVPGAAPWPGFVAVVKTVRPDDLKAVIFLCTATHRKRGVDGHVPY